uniref:Putative secreted protein n=1 Tax=Anopheles marajoara TaxID=58244 RepID=A0A2M4CEK4_9DIPT
MCVYVCVCVLHSSVFSSGAPVWQGSIRYIMVRGWGIVAVRPPHLVTAQPLSHKPPQLCLPSSASLCIRLS